MANRYWIASTQQNWNSTSNWSTTSGGASGASVPGSSDTAIFDSNGLGRCVINANATWGAFTKTAGDVYLNYNITLTINGAFSHTGGDFTVQSRPNFEFNQNGFLVVFGNFTESTSGTFDCNDAIINVYGNMTTGSKFYTSDATVMLYGLSKTYAPTISTSNNYLFQLIIEGICTCDTNLIFTSNSSSELVINGTLIYGSQFLQTTNLRIAGHLEMTYDSSVPFLLVNKRLNYFYGELTGEPCILILNGSNTYLAPGDYRSIEEVVIISENGIDSNCNFIDEGLYYFNKLNMGTDNGDNIINLNGSTINANILQCEPTNPNILTIKTQGSKINLIDGNALLTVLGDTIWESHENTLITTSSNNSSAISLASNANDTNIYDDIYVYGPTTIYGY